MKELFKDKVFLKNLGYLAIPIILQELLNSSVNIVDTFMIGRLGSASVAAVGLGNQIFFLFMLLCFGINSGASIFMGQYWGKGDVKSIHKVMGISFLMALFAAGVFCMGAVCFPEALMKIYSKDNEVVMLGASYLRVIGFSYFLTALIVIINGALKVTGQTRQPMFTTLISLLSNVILNYIFIFKCNFGVQGAALGTLLARTIELSCQLIFSFRFKRPIATNIKSYFKIERTFIKPLLVITMPVILNEFVWALGTSIYNIAYKYSGTVAQAAVQIAGTVQNLFVVVGMGVGAACGIMLSNALGAGDIQKAIKYARKCMVLAVALSLVMGVILAIFSPYIVECFKVDQEARIFAYKMLLVVSVGMVFKTFNYTSIVGILRSGGDTKFCLLVDACSVWLIGVPMAFLGSKILGLPIYITFAMVYLEEVAKLIVSGKRVLSNIWAKTLVD